MRSKVNQMARTSKQKLPALNRARGKAWLHDKDLVPEGKTKRMQKVKIVDLFAGIGGFHYGIAAAAAKRGRSVEALLVVEKDPTCNETYFRNHHVESQGDITHLQIEEGKEADILTAGFPCQPFSNSGKKRGLSDPRGQFYERIEDLIRKYSAKSFILENVPGIRTNGTSRGISSLAWVPDQKIGSTMHTLESRLTKLAVEKDYTIRWIELDSSDFGSPQVRKRVYIVGVRNDFDFIDLDFEPVQQFSFAHVRETGGVEVSGTELSVAQQYNIRKGMRESPPSYKDGMRRIGKAYACEGGNVGQAYHAFGKVPTLTRVWARFLPVYFPADGETVPVPGERAFSPNCRLYGSGHLRRASVREVMRLQGFPDTFKPHEIPRVAYEHAGNSVNTLVVSALAGRLLDQIKK